jgi:hypothetical protein
MTTSKWIGSLAVMMFLVFGVTYILNYVGPAPQSDDTTSDDSNTTLPVLNFPTMTYPISVNGVWIGRSELEYRKPGYQDYWFSNENDVKVKIGAISKSCKCQGVEVFILPEGKKPRLPNPPLSPTWAAGLGLLGRSALQQFADESESNKDLEAIAEQVITLNPDKPSAAEVEIPPHRYGWVRMKWTGEKAGKMNLTATFWMHHPGSGPELTLQRLANFVDPVTTVLTDNAIGALELRELPRTLWFEVWSSTRKSFKITKAEAIRAVGLSARSDAFSVGEPVALTDAMCARTAAKHKCAVLSAYMIPVTIQSSAPDGSLCEIGNFRRRIEVQTDALDSPLPWTFSGVIRGDFRVTNVDDSGSISFGSFRRDSMPPPRFVYIQSETPDLKLELESNRVPEYLSAKLVKESAAGDPVNTWKLEIGVLPRAYGRFPRDDDPAYRDSAVYIHTIGKTPEQRIRVSVRGDAGNG